MHSLRRWVVSLLLITAGCGDLLSGKETPKAGEVQVVGPQTNVHHSSDLVPIEVRVQDTNGRPLAGATVSMRVDAGGGFVTPAESATDADGVVRGSWTLGAGAGRNVLMVAVVGTSLSKEFALEARPGFRVTFEKDSLVLPGLGCGEVMYAPVSFNNGTVAEGEEVIFTATQPDLVRLNRPPPSGGFSGLRLSMKSSVISVQVGTTQLIATHKSGAADTAVVTVQPTRPTWIFNPDLFLGVGESSQMEARVYDGCGSAINGAPLTYQSTDPAIITVSASGMAAGHRAGKAMIITTSGTLSDTLPVTVLRVVVSPADTTVFVGDTIQYRLKAYDENETVVMPARSGSAVIYSGTPAVADFPPPIHPYDGTARTATALSAGTATIVGYINGYRGRTTLRVIPRP